MDRPSFSYGAAYADLDLDGVELARREEAVVILISAFGLMTLLEVRGKVEEALPGPTHYST